jgi:hypothetical protein
MPMLLWETVLSIEPAISLVCYTPIAEIKNAALDNRPLIQRSLQCRL